jgi:uncharacterized membrane protein YoaK (UPF0700 family)
MAFIGGFLGGFSILNHGDLFGSAQTANLITIAMEVVGRNRADFFIRIIGLLIYMTGLSSTVLIPKLFKINMKIFSIIIDTIVIVIVAFLPESTNNFVALYPVFFAMSIQWCTFKGAEGYNTSSIFSTNNLRQFTTSFTEYFCTRDSEALKKCKLYGKVLFFFHAGVMVSYISCQILSIHGALVCLIPAASAATLILIEHVQQNEALLLKSRHA